LLQKAQNYCNTTLLLRYLTMSFRVDSLLVSNVGCLRAIVLKENKMKTTLHRKCTCSDLYIYIYIYIYRLCAVVLRVPGYKSRGPGSIPGTAKKKR
jgi:hypothetical protein